MSSLVADALSVIPAEVLVISVTEMKFVEPGVLLLTLSHKAADRHSLHRVCINEKLFIRALAALNEWDDRYRRLVVAFFSRLIVDIAFSHSPPIDHVLCVPMQEPPEEDDRLKDAQFFAIVEQFCTACEELSLVLAQELLVYPPTSEVCHFLSLYQRHPPH